MLLQPQHDKNNNNPSQTPQKKNASFFFPADRVHSFSHSTTTTTAMATLYLFLSCCIHIRSVTHLTADSFDKPPALPPFQTNKRSQATPQNHQDLVDARIQLFFRSSFLRKQRTNTTGPRFNCRRAPTQKPTVTLFSRCRVSSSYHSSPRHRSHDGP